MCRRQLREMKFCFKLKMASNKETKVKTQNDDDYDENDSRTNTTSVVLFSAIVAAVAENGETFDKGRSVTHGRSHLGTP